MSKVRIEALGDRALLISFGERIDPAVNALALAAAAALRTANLPGLRDIAPAYASVCVQYEPCAWDDPAGERSPHECISTRIGEIVYSLQNGAPSSSLSPDGAGGEGWGEGGQGYRTTHPWGDCRSASLPHPQSAVADFDPLTLPSPPSPAMGERDIIEIAVCYGGDFGPDLAALAKHAGLDENEVVTRHSASTYRVAMLGFAPGFPYLLGLDPALGAPRRASPRVRVPAGSVAIGGAQTGIYPRELPGGWLLIGRTPLALFDPVRDPPALLAPGQCVRFRSIGADEFMAFTR